MLLLMPLVAVSRAKRVYVSLRILRCSLSLGVMTSKDRAKLSFEETIPTFLSSWSHR